VSSVQTTGNLGGFAGADALCQSLASASSISGVYRAWLADSTLDPATLHTKSGAPYVRIDLVVVADDWADLTDGTIQNPIWLDETGFVRGDRVWTNVTAIGAGAVGGSDHCVDWSSASSGASGAYGETSGGGAPGGWTEFGSEGCDQLNRIYCIEQ
jgi:hypothetical protein